MKLFLTTSHPLPLQIIVLLQLKQLGKLELYYRSFDITASLGCFCPINFLTALSATWFHASKSIRPHRLPWSSKWKLLLNFLDNKPPFSSLSIEIITGPGNWPFALNSLKKKKVLKFANFSWLSSHKEINLLIRVANQGGLFIHHGALISYSMSFSIT